MKIPPKPVDCYIGSFIRPLKEDYLEANGFSRGMILFAIPSHGILFKCRADGHRLDLEFGAFFAALRFIKSSLADEKIRDVRVLSSHPEFVFAVMNSGEQIKRRPERAKMLKEYLDHFDIQISLVPTLKNRALLTPEDLPSTPKDQTPPVKPPLGKPTRIRFRPIQKGLHL